MNNLTDSFNFKIKMTGQKLLAQNPNLNHLVEPRFQVINRLFF